MVFESAVGPGALAVTKENKTASFGRGNGIHSASSNRRLADDAEGLEFLTASTIQSRWEHGRRTNPREGGGCGKSGIGRMKSGKVGGETEIHDGIGGEEEMRIPNTRVSNQLCVLLGIPLSKISIETARKLSGLSLATSGTISTLLQVPCLF